MWDCVSCIYSSSHEKGRGGRKGEGGEEKREEHTIPIPILAHLLHQLRHRDATQISRQSRQMLYVGPVFVYRRALLVRVRKHEDVLRDGLARAVGDFPDFVVFADEGAVFGYGAAFGDEPAHVEDFELAVVVVAGGLVSTGFWMGLGRGFDDEGGGGTHNQDVLFACLLLSYLLMISVP